jgi:hypothetical protein
MNKKMLTFLYIILIISLFACTDKNITNEELPSNGLTQNNTSMSNDLLLPQVDDPSKILNEINLELINLVKHLYDSNMTLEEMEKDYGSIIGVDWIDGAYYKHENIDFWVAYYYNDSFVVGFENNEPYESLVDYDGVQYTQLVYPYGEPYSILDEARQAPVLNAKCRLADLFGETDDIYLEDFSSFAMGQINTKRGFSVAGTVKPISGDEYLVDLHYEFDDVIDPNPGRIDQGLAVAARAMGYNAKDYNIIITEDCYFTTRR